MTSSLCSSCLQPKAKSDLACGLCGKTLCKGCSQFLDPSFFSLMASVPEGLRHSVYCHSCFQETVVPAQEAYEARIEAARGLHVFYKNERNVPLISKSNVRVTVEDCEDKKEALLRLAFQAAEAEYNGLTHTEMTSKKVIVAGYQKTYWSGSAFPSKVRED